MVIPNISKNITSLTVSLESVADGRRIAQHLKRNEATLTRTSPAQLSEMQPLQDSKAISADTSPPIRLHSHSFTKDTNNSTGTETVEQYSESDDQSTITSGTSLSGSHLPHPAKSVEGKATSIIFCRKCNSPNSVPINGDVLYSRCTTCNHHFCLISTCLKTFPQKECREHFLLCHRMLITNNHFNVASDFLCSCSRPRLFEYANRKAISKCRKCKQCRCLVKECNRVFDNLLECVSHQHEVHTEFEINKQTYNRDPKLCDGCGRSRHKTTLLFKGHQKFECNYCKSVWCLIGRCNMEFSSLQAWKVHAQKFHGNSNP